eukprot:376352-Alexandrium_andersonii.AAC.1
MYPVRGQALSDIMARCPGGAGEAPVHLALVANTIALTGAQTAPPAGSGRGSHAAGVGAAGPAASSA